MELLIHNLDKDNFFYQAVATLSFAQFGINEIFSRGFYLKHRVLFPENNDFIHYIESLPFPNDVKQEIYKTQTFTPLIFVPGFMTKDKNMTYRLDPHPSALQFVEDQKGLTDKNIELTHMTIITAWEKIMQFNLADSSVLQFFRHIRNAAAHNGKFYFQPNTIDNKTGELKKEAKWKSFEIKSSLENMTLISKDKNDKTSFWDQGDLVEFLLDFENHYDEIKNNHS